MVNIYNEERLNEVLFASLEKLDVDKKMSLIWENINYLCISKCPAINEIKCHINKNAKNGNCIQAILNYIKE